MTVEDALIESCRRRGFQEPVISQDTDGSWDIRMWRTGDNPDGPPYLAVTQVPEDEGRDWAIVSALCFLIEETTLKAAPVP